MQPSKLLKQSQFSPIVFAILGLLCGLLFSKSLMMGFTCLGACFGAVVGIIAAGSCIVVNRRSYVSKMALIFNLLLFIVVAKELQIIG